MAKTPFVFKKPTKHVIIEILGGGDSDGLYLDTNDPQVAHQAESMYVLTSGGELGHSMTGMSVANVMLLLKGEQLSPTQMGGQPHFYTVVQRVEDENELQLRMHYTAGRNTSIEEHDDSKPGWVNTAIRRFIKANYEDVELDRIIMFWICEDLRHGVGTVVEKSQIESTFGDVPLEAKCERIVQRISKHLDEYDATFEISGDLIFFRPTPKSSEPQPV